MTDPYGFRKVLADNPKMAEQLAEATGRRSTAPPKHAWMQNALETWSTVSVRTHFPDDELSYDCRMTYMPTSDNHPLPMVVIYIQIDGTEKVDGLYLTQFISPSLVSADVLDEVIKRLAMQSRNRRGEIRNSLARGDTRSELSLPKPE